MPIPCTFMVAIQGIVSTLENIRWTEYLLG